MGHVKNHLATLVCGVFAVVLTGLWPLMIDFEPILNLVFLMAVPIMWFLTAVCFVAQKSTDYMHGTHPVTTTSKKSKKGKKSKSPFSAINKVLTDDQKVTFKAIKIAYKEKFKAIHEQV